MNEGALPVITEEQKEALKAFDEQTEAANRAYEHSVKHLPTWMRPRDKSSFVLGYRAAQSPQPNPTLIT